MNSYKDAVNLAVHYKAIGQTDIILPFDVEKPWHLVGNFIAPNDTYGRYSLTQGLEFFAHDPLSGLDFTWYFDIEEDDATFDAQGIQRCATILQDLPPVASAQFKEHLRTCIRVIYDEGTIEIDKGKRMQNDAVLLSSLVQP